MKNIKWTQMSPLFLCLFETLISDLSSIVYDKNINFRYMDLNGFKKAITKSVVKNVIIGILLIVCFIPKNIVPLSSVFGCIEMHMGKFSTWGVLQILPHLNPKGELNQKQKQQPKPKLKDGKIAFH